MKQRLTTSNSLVHHGRPIGLAVVLLMTVAVGQPAAAEGGSQSYVQDQYYLGVGGTPPSLAAFAANPRQYLRHEAAYQSLKQGFEQAVDTELSDADFSQLLASDRVRLIVCSGRIDTPGITPQGRVSYAVRDCYAGEHLIQVRTSGGWVTVASQGCFNLVRPAPPEKVCRLVAVDEGAVYNRTNTWRVPGQSIELCNCGDTFGLPAASGVTRSTIRSTRLVRVCE